MKRYLRATFQSLANRNFRLYFTGQAISLTGTWMQRLAQVWLVLELTGSGTLLGVTAALQQLPTLLVSPWGGLLADRVDKRKILLLTQTSAAVPAILLGALTATDRITLWMVLVLAFALGIIESLDKPARHSFVIEMVGPRQLANAVTLNSLIVNAGKVTGPAIGGVLINVLGLAPTFAINAASFLAVVAGLLLIRPDELERTAPSPRRRGQLREGLRYVRGQPGLLGPLVLVAVTGLLVYEWTVTVPLFAYDTFDGDAETIGLMFSAMGAGAVLGGLAVAGILRPTGSRLITAGLVLSSVLLLTAAAPNVTLACITLFLVGVASIAFRAIATSLLQLRSDPQMRGRVVSLLVVAIGGTTPIGGPVLGWLAESFGARTTLATGAVATAIASVATLIYLQRSGVLDAAGPWNGRPRLPRPTRRKGVAR